MATTPVSLEQFGQSIKAKHPEYADMSDADVANKVLAKYPQYKDMVSTAPTPPPQPGFLENFGKSTGLSALAHLPDTIKQSYDPSANPITSLVQGGARIAGELGQAYGAARGGNLGAAGSHVISAIPFVGPALDTATEAAQARGMNAPSNSYLQDLGIAATTPGTLGTVAGTSAQLAPMVLGAADAKFPGRPTIPTPGAAMVGELRSPTRGYNSPLIPRNEAIARKAADILNINPTLRRTAITSMTERMPDIKETLGEAGVAKPKPIEFAKAASQGGEVVSDFYKQHFIEPNADAIAGSGTVAEDYARVSQINKELAAIYRSPTMGQQMTKEAAQHMEDLAAEGDVLNAGLYATISERSGIPVDLLREINQRGAQLQGVGDVAEAAQGIRASGQNYGPGGLTIPMGTIDKISRFGNWFRGGTEAVKGRQLGRLMGQVNEPRGPLPNPEEIAGFRGLVQQEERQRLLENVGLNIAERNKNLALSAARVNQQAQVPTEPPSYASHPAPSEPTTPGETLRAEGRARFQAAKAAAEEVRLKAAATAAEVKRQAELRSQQLRAKAKEKQAQARVVREY